MDWFGNSKKKPKEKHKQNYWRDCDGILRKTIARNGYGQCSIEVGRKENAEKTWIGCTCCTFDSQKVCLHPLYSRAFHENNKPISSIFLSRRACSSSKRQTAGNGINSQDQLLSQSTDEQEEYSWVRSLNLESSGTVVSAILIVCFPHRQRSVCRRGIQRISHCWKHAPHCCSYWAFLSCFP